MIDRAKLCAVTCALLCWLGAAEITAQPPTWSPLRPSQGALRTGEVRVAERVAAEELPTVPGAQQESAEVRRREDGAYVIPFSVSQPGIDVRSHGERVSVVAKDASLKELLAMLARSQKLNLVYSSPPIPPPPKGNPPVPNLLLNPTVTVALEDVPLDTALDTILAVAGHTWTRSGGIILVTPNSQHAKLPPNAQGRTMRVFEFDFARAEDVDLAVKGLLSPVGQSFANTSIDTDNRRSKEVLVVEDLPRYVERISMYIAQFDTPPRQVAIQAYVLQVDLDGETRHGVNLEYFARLADPAIRLGTTGFASGVASQAFFLELDGNRLDGLLEILRSTVDAKTLASPRIIAVNGQQARLQVGEQLGFRVTTTTQTSTLESVEFLNVGVVLSVTPRISRDGRVLLNVRPEVSSGQVNPETGLPEEETAELETDVLLENGQGIVVGGLIKEDLQNNQSKIPGLGDVPYLGALFERRQDRRQRSEIIVALVPQVLPNEPRHDPYGQVEFERATTPLLKGSLVENPRPYEPSLPDPLRPLKRDRDLRSNQKEFMRGTAYSARTGTNTELRDTGAMPTEQPRPRPFHPSRILRHLTR